MTARDKGDMRSEGATFREWKGKMIGLEEVIEMHILNLAMTSNFQVFIYAQAIGSSQWSCCDCWQAGGAAPKQDSWYRKQSRKPHGRRDRGLDVGYPVRRIKDEIAQSILRNAQNA